jgi:LCP family protein required for cell wall assembly
MKEETKQKIKKKPALKIVLISLGGLILLAGLTVFLVAHYYISKLNIVSDDAPVPAVTAGYEIEVIEEEPDDGVGEEVTQEQLEEIQSEIDENVNDREIYGDDGVLNVLIIGSDTRIIGQAGRSDVMVLVSLNKDTKQITLTSLMRDIYLYIPEYGYNRINAAYAFGGAKLLLETVQNNFKIEVEHYIETDFYSFVDIVDALGGITVDVKDADLRTINATVKAINDYYSLDHNDGVLESAGTYHLSGKQTLGYVRSETRGRRLYRTSHQREVLSKLSARAFGMSMSEADDFLCTICRRLPRICRS